MNPYAREQFWFGFWTAVFPSLFLGGILGILAHGYTTHTLWATQ